MPSKFNEIDGFLVRLREIIAVSGVRANQYGLDEHGFAIWLSDGREIYAPLATKVDAEKYREAVLAALEADEN